MLDNEIIIKLKKANAIIEGHFVLTSGRHSNLYIEKFRVLEDPVLLEYVANKMAQNYINSDIDIVVGAAVGGILISSAIAKIFGVKSIFTERVNSKMKFKRGFKINKGANVLVVEDIVTTGGSINELLEVLSQFSCNIIGIVSLLDRNEEPLNFQFPYFPLIQYPVKSWDVKDIPKWLQNIPITKPGSTGK
tara:strand:+ start:37 stop:609 length:573 start_codon:yes stop_codon:yes gene_type:complete